MKTMLSDFDEIPKIICWNCEKKIPIDLEVCPFCGTKIDLEIWKEINEIVPENS